MFGLHSGQIYEIREALGGKVQPYPMQAYTDANEYKKS